MYGLVVIFVHDFLVIFVVPSIHLDAHTSIVVVVVDESIRIGVIAILAIAQPMVIASAFLLHHGFNRSLVFVGNVFATKRGALNAAWAEMTKLRRQRRGIHRFVILGHG